MKIKKPGEITNKRNMTMNKSNDIMNEKKLDPRKNKLCCKISIGKMSLFKDPI